MKIKDFLIKLLGGYKLIIAIGEDSGQRVITHYSTLYPFKNNTFIYKNLHIHIDPNEVIRVERKHVPKPLSKEMEIKP